MKLRHIRKRQQARWNRWSCFVPFTWLARKRRLSRMILGIDPASPDGDRVAVIGRVDRFCFYMSPSSVARDLSNDKADALAYTMQGLRSGALGEIRS